MGFENDQSRVKEWAVALNLPRSGLLEPAHAADRLRRLMVNVILLGKVA
jgi:hypothetical protein